MIQHALLLCLLLSNILLSAQQINIPFRMSNSNTMTVKVTINGNYQRDFIWDTGASVTTIPESMFKAMLRSGDVSNQDITGHGQASLADGSICDVFSVRLQSLSIGNFNYPNCEVSVIVGAAGSLLIGQNVIQKLGAITIDPAKKLIISQGATIPNNVPQSTGNHLVAIAEVKVIPCSKRKVKEVKQIHSLLQNGSLTVTDLTEETNVPPPQKAIDRIRAEYVIRYFDNNDMSAAKHIEGVLLNSVKGEVLVENMVPYYPRPLSGKIEIWIK